MVTIGVIVGSVRQGRNGIRLAKFIQTELAKREDVKAELIDPLELNLPVLVNRYDTIKESPDCPAALHGLAKTLQSCDGFLIVSPEYNYSVPPAISNTLDYFYGKEYYLKPVGIASYSMGSFGGVRASVALLPMLQCLGLVPIPKTFPVPTVQNALTEEGHVSETTTFPKIRENFSGFANELIWAAKVLKEGKAAGGPN
ncbi:UNVERIFIED_CONTAM: hypothetical protein HDU68_006853 [Siphonaria sp. JEL0065]|nr:hypothetical protein HDU68_006847 [Siphonaria sp. JEL0065]KAJ3032080.1 hypothetical protein HDU68_006853 [Siphonaria sp. JEL0065]